MEPVDRFWECIDRSSKAYAMAPAAPLWTTNSSSSDEEGDGDSKKRHTRRWRRVLDVMAVLWWLYVFTKLFVYDIDRWALQRLGLNADHIFRYRLAFVAALIVIASFWIRKGVLFVLIYVPLFPLILILWKLPWFLYRRKSWLLVVATVNVLIVALANLRRKAIAFGLMTIAMVVLLVSRIGWVVDGAIIVALGILSYWYMQVLRYSIVRTEFLRVQDSLFERAVNSEPVKLVSSQGMRLMATDVEMYPKSELETFINELGQSIVINRAMYFWAYQIDKYRKSAASLIAACIQYVALFLSTAIVYSLVNRAIFRTAAGEYTWTGGFPSAFRITLYSFGSLVFNSRSGIEATGNMASAVSVIAGVMGVVFLVGLMLSAAISSRLKNDDEGTQTLIATLKSRASAQEGYFRQNFAISMDEAIQRMQAVGYAFSGIIGFLASSIPPEFMAPRPDEASQP
jgi:hypothetical protein